MAFRDHPLVIFGARVLARVGVKALASAKESVLEDVEQLTDAAADEVKARVRKQRRRSTTSSSS